MSVSTPQTQPPSLGATNFTQILIPKLQHDNYPTWTMVIVPFLEGNNFYGYVTGDLPCPPKFLSSTATAAGVVNPAYTSWYQQDELIMSVVISSLRGDCG
jgi:phospholipase C